MKRRDEMNDDELLGAWIDGELPRDEAERLERRLAEEPALADRLERMQAADRAAQRAFHAVDETPLPRRVLGLLQDDGTGRREETPGKVVRLPLRGPRRFFHMPATIAAGVALVAGFLIHDLIGPAAGPDLALTVTGTIAPGSDLDRVLETLPSAEPVTLIDGANAEVVLTFRAAAGDWCRQFRVDADAATMHGLACRQADGWRLATASFGAGTSGGTFGQAAGETPAALEASVRDRMGDRGPLERQAEKEVISMGWKESD